MYKLEELDGTIKPGEFSARRLRAFTPREGMDLAREQKAIEEGLAREEEEQLEVQEMEEGPVDEANNMDSEGTEGDQTEDNTIASRVAGRLIYCVICC